MTSNNRNLTDILPKLLSKHALHYRVETPDSASQLITQHQLTPSHFIELYPEIERTLLTSFVEDDYEGKLHFMTLNTSPASNTDRQEVVGIAFWREIDDVEMEEWLDLHRVKETLRRHPADDEASQPRISFKCEADDALSHRGKRRMELIRSNSVTWIRNALHSSAGSDQRESVNAKRHVKHDNSLNVSSSSSQIARLTHSWIKIELLAVKNSHRHHHYGGILLASMLSVASSPHAILHIAGSSSSNVAARKLYERFSFVHLPRYEEGGPFDKPDGDLYVLGDVGRVLEQCPWDECFS